LINRGVNWNAVVDSGMFL